jgi:hypothetical protein
MSSLVAEYCETFDTFRKQKESTALDPSIEEVFEEELSRIWNELSVEGCQEVERRYPELRVRRF